MPKKHSLLFILRLHQIVPNYKSYRAKCEEQTTALIAAIREKNITEVKSIFKTNKSFLNAIYRDMEGNTLVHIAALFSAYVSGVDFNTILQSLIDIGCPIDAVNNNNIAPVELAGARYLKDQFRLVSRQEAYRNKIAKIEKLYGGKNYLYKKDRVGVRIYPGVREISDLHLTRGSKSPTKTCQIPDTWQFLDMQDEQQFSLHDRLAMACYFSSANTSSLSQLEAGFDGHPSNNYVTMNIGFVVSSKVHVKHGDHRRIFVSIPVSSPDYLVFWKRFVGKESVHSEEMLFEFLKDKASCASILSILQHKYHIVPGFKIYAIILDIHSDYDMCNECTGLVFNEQGKLNYLANLMALLFTSESKYILPKPKKMFDILTPASKTLDIVTRVSSSREFRSGRTTEVESGFVYPSFNGDVFDRDIKKFANAVILKDTRRKRYRPFWQEAAYSSSLMPSSNKVTVSRQTAFLNFFRDPAPARRQSVIPRKVAEKDEQFVTFTL
jgi:hypothetical protein